MTCSLKVFLALKFAVQRKEKKRCWYDDLCESQLALSCSEVAEDWQVKRCFELSILLRDSHELTKKGSDQTRRRLMEEKRRS